MTWCYKGLDIFKIKILYFEFFHNLFNVQKWFHQIFFQRFELDFLLELEDGVDSFGVHINVLFFFLELILFLSWDSAGDGIDDCEFGFLIFGDTEIGKFFDHGTMRWVFTFIDHLRRLCYIFCL